MALALYRKYRPQTFKEISGQEHIKVTLEREVATNKVAHAYLFSGPRGTGKTSLARILAKAVNCEKRKKSEGEPCNKCDVCTVVTQGRALDIIEIDAASYTGVDTVRETIVETAKFAPSKFKAKVFIIDEAHMLSTSAWNALLKIMEEPPEHVIFILATTEVHKVPATILSRCQRFDFHRIAPVDLVKRLSLIASKEKVKVTKPVLEQVARLSEGCVRDAEGILEQLFSLGQGEVDEDTASLVLPRTSMPMAVDLLEALGSKDARGALEIVGKLLDQGINLTQFSQNVLELLRLVLVSKVTGDNKMGAVDQSTAERLGKLSESLELKQILKLIDGFVKAKQQLKGASIPQLPLEIAVVEVCGFEEQTAPKPQKPQKVELKAKQEPLAKVDSNPSPPPRQVAPPVKEEKVKGKISLDAVKDKWPEVIKQVQSENHSLPFLLSSSEPVGIEKDTIQIGVQYPFHCDKLNEVKCRALLEKVVSEVCQTPVQIEAVVRVQAPAPDNSVDEVLNTLGGRVINE